MAKLRLRILVPLFKGVLVAALVTIASMLVIAALAVFMMISDKTIFALNQAVKIISIIIGVWAAVGRGGEQGFITGMAVAMIYMIIGYLMYALLGGNAFFITDMLGEILIGAAVGGVVGTVLANLPARSRRKRHRA